MATPTTVQGSVRPSGNQSGIQPVVMKATRKQLLAQLPKYEEAMSNIGTGGANYAKNTEAKHKKFERPVSPAFQADDDSDDMSKMKESLEDTMRTIQEMRLIQNV